MDHGWCRIAAVLLFVGICVAQEAYLDFGPEELIDANGILIQVPGYSVPSLIDWNSDGLLDLMIGEGGGGVSEAKIRIYLNQGSSSVPLYEDYFYFCNGSSEAIFPGAGCLGCFPRMSCFNNDDMNDMIVGLSDGSIRFYRNRGTQEEPVFNGYLTLSAVVAECNCHVDFDQSIRRTLDILDYDGDGNNDLVIGGLDGLITPYLNVRNTGTFRIEEQVPVMTTEGVDLDVPSGRSSPIVVDWDGDGLRDILSGNTDGQILFYKNVGTEAGPIYDANAVYLDSEGVPIDLEGSARSRPSLCYWPDQDIAAPADAYPDLLVGSSDGCIHLYRGTREPEDLNGDAVVDIQDFAVMANHWGEVLDPNNGLGDQNGDLFIDSRDLAALGSQWLQGFGPQGYQVLHPQDFNEL